MDYVLLIRLVLTVLSLFFSVFTYAEGATVENPFHYEIIEKTIKKYQLQSSSSSANGKIFDSPSDACRAHYAAFKTSYTKSSYRIEGIQCHICRYDVYTNNTYCNVGSAVIAPIQKPYCELNQEKSLAISEQQLLNTPKSGSFCVDSCEYQPIDASHCEYTVKDTTTQEIIEPPAGTCWHFGETTGKSCELTTPPDNPNPCPEGLDYDSETGCHSPTDPTDPSDCTQAEKDANNGVCPTDTGDGTGDGSEDCTQAEKDANNGVCPTDTGDGTGDGSEDCTQAEKDANNGVCPTDTDSCPAGYIQDGNGTCTRNIDDGVCDLNILDDPDCPASSDYPEPDDISKYGVDKDIGMLDDIKSYVFNTKRYDVGGQCPADRPINLPFGTITISYKGICMVLSYLSFIFVFLAWFSVGYMVVK